MAGQTIYLDHHATTPLDPRVLEAMLPFYGARFGNPHSSSHRVGRAAAEAVDAARAEVAALVGAHAGEIIFTSGATEANNLAILGSIAACQGDAAFVTTSVEHASVRQTAAALAETGRRVTILPVGPDGRLDPVQVESVLTPAVGLVSVILANNEIGVIQPLEEIGRLCRRAGVRLHADAAQAAGKIPVDVERLGVDLLSLSAHKIYGPMGIGALYVRGGVALRPLFHGGAQEGGLRPGTLPTALCVGFGAACRLAREERAAEAARLADLRDRLFARLANALPDLRLNGSALHRLPGNLNISLPGVEAEDWLAAVPELALSTGAACASGSQAPSHVLRAIGLTEAEIQGSIRIGIGRFTTVEEIDRAAALLLRRLAALRRDDG
jgi:cysteine desulfurase